MVLPALQRRLLTQEVEEEQEVADVVQELGGQDHMVQRPQEVEEEVWRVECQGGLGLQATQNGGQGEEEQGSLPALQRLQAQQEDGGCG